VRDRWRKSTRRDRRASGSRSQGLLEDHDDAADAVVVGNLPISLLRHSDRVQSASLAQLVNVIAPIVLTCLLTGSRPACFWSTRGRHTHQPTGRGQPTLGLDLDRVPRGPSPPRVRDRRRHRRVTFALGLIDSRVSRTAGQTRPSLRASGLVVAADGGGPDLPPRALSPAPNTPDGRPRPRRLIARAGKHPGVRLSVQSQSTHAP